MPLNIRINENYRITSDSLNVIVSRRHVVDPTKSPNWAKLKAKGADPSLREEWKELRYYCKVEDALDGVIDLTVLESEAESIPALRDEIRQIRREISAVMDARD